VAVLSSSDVQSTWNDLQAAAEEFPEGSAIARELGHRSILTVPMLRERTVVGIINVRRTEAIPFTPGQIALLETFADQAVIAIENVRLFTELAGPPIVISPRRLNSRRQRLRSCGHQQLPRRISSRSFRPS
jgi:GAF domain-containing protein